MRIFRPYSSISRWAVAAILLTTLLRTPAAAGPPFLTDDPEPVPLHHWELYTFASGDAADGTNTVVGPAIEVNNGVANNTQLHIIVPDVTFFQSGASTSGLGDIETGVKYRFVQQTKLSPDIGVFPLVFVPSGNSSENLGSGRLTAKAPIWLQKDWKSWTSYGGFGYAYNPVPGRRDYWFGGDLIQKTITPALTLGAEMFFQGASAYQAPLSQNANGISSQATTTAGSRPTAIWNIGGQLNINSDFSLLFSAGHSFRGDGNLVFYIALYRTWGPGSP